MAANKKTAPKTKYSPEEQKTLQGLTKLLKGEGRFRVRAAFKTLQRSCKLKSKNQLRGLCAMLEQDGVLFGLDDAAEGTKLYYSNQPGFYKPERLHKLLPQDEYDRIVGFVQEHEQSLHTIAKKAYGNRTVKPLNFVATILAVPVEQGLVSVDKQSNYILTDRGREFGVDQRTLEFMENAEVENRIAAKAESQRPDADKLGPDQVQKLLEQDLKETRIPTVDITPLVGTKKSFKLLPLAEILIGNRFTDMRLLNYIMSMSKPDITVVSGLVQGAYSANQKSKQLVLSGKGGLNKVGHQLAAAGNVLTALEGITSEKVFYTPGDDDVAMADDYALLAQKGEGKFWQIGVRGDSLSAEQAYRLAYREFLNKRSIQLNIIQPYQLRLGRGLKNSTEVFEAIGVRKSEYRLIIEILTLKARGKEWPKPYEQVVNIAALEGNLGKRVVTPDTLCLRLPTGQGRAQRELLFVHNTNFSDITQFADPIQAMEMSVRQRLASGHKVPFMTIDSQQEMFYGTYIGDIPGSGGNFMMTLPGMQNSLQEAEYKMKAQFRGSKTSKSHRQNTFRKKLAIPGAAEWEFLDDGRIRIRIINNRTRQVLHDQRDQPEVCEGIAFVTDTQHGSLTMVPEVEALYMDYALYHRKAQHLYENGDIIHGTNYPQHFAENRPLRMISMNSQQEFTLGLQMPLIRNAPALRVFGAWLGNHEWNSIGRHLSGTNDLLFLKVAVDEYRKGILAGGGTTPLEEVFNASRVRWGRTHNPTNGDMVNWPYYARTIGGFKLAISHLWQLWGGGRTPIDKQRKWLTGMSRAAGDIDFMFGGHWHSLWWCQEAEKLLLQVPSTASQSGYELILGLMSTVMCSYIEVSNRTGVTIELVPWEFLYNEYKPESEFLKGKTHLLKRPKPGTIDHKYSKMSPFIEGLIDQLTQHITV